MAGRFLICFVAAFALIQPFNTLPAAQHDVIYRTAKGEYCTKDGVILTDQYPIFYRPSNVQTTQEAPKQDHVVIVEQPTVTYRAEYSTQASPSSTSSSSTTFRASPQEGNQANFRAYDGSSTVSYYPYYIRPVPSDQNNANRRVFVDPSDPAYQRFVPRDSPGRCGNSTKIQF